MIPGSKHVRHSICRAAKKRFWLSCVTAGLFGFIIWCSALQPYKFHATPWHNGMRQRLTRKLAKGMPVTSGERVRPSVGCWSAGFGEGDGRSSSPQPSTLSSPLGLRELIGDRSPLSRAPGAGTDSASWKPAAAWYSSQDIPFLFPNCSVPESEDCETWYSVETTSAVQAALWSSQNPPDCSTARYMVLDTPWLSGLGSSLHIHMYMLAIAIRNIPCISRHTRSDDRILVPAENISWTFAVPDLCQQAQKYARDSSKYPSTYRYLDCFFLPTTRCKLPPDWHTSARELTALNMADKVVRAAAVHQTTFPGLTHIYSWAVRSKDPVLAFHRHKPTSWWFAQLTKFVVRPTDYTLRHLVWPLQQSAFYQTQGALPHPLAAMFIRAGDKHTETPLQSVDAHFAELEPVAATMGIQHVYVSSDSRDSIAEAVDRYSGKYIIHFINWERPGAGFDAGKALSVKDSWRMRELMRLTLADMFITAQADAMVGTLTSNQGQLSDEFRRVHGKGQVPFSNPGGKVLRPGYGK